MVELPGGAEGLSWITNREPLHLLLIPGLQSASIAAAAAGDQEALSYLRFVAQYSAAHRGMLNPSKLDSCCLKAAELREDSEGAFDIEAELKETPDEIREAFLCRHRFTTKLMETAVEEGQLAALQWIRALCHQIEGDDWGLMEVAARQGSLAILKFLRSGPRPAPWSAHVLEAALRHPPCLQWLLSQPEPCPYHTRIVDRAASCGSIEALKVLRAAKLPATMWDMNVSASAAACLNPIPVLQWLQAQEPQIPLGESTCSAAARLGNLSLLQWLRAQRPPCPWSSASTAAAAGANKLSVLQWLRAQDPPCPWRESCSSAAAAAGNVSMLQWLQGQDPPCPMTSHCTSRAAQCGQLAALQCLVAQSACPLASDCMEYAALNSDLPMLQWLHEQGEPLSSSLYLPAARHGRCDIVRWLHSQGVPALPAPAGSKGSQHATRSLRYTSIPILLFLADIGCHMDKLTMKRLQHARRTLCTFHALLRWCRRAVSDPSKGMHRAFNELATHHSGQTLLVRLSLLPPELIDRIAVAAELQHDLFT